MSQRAERIRMEPGDSPAISPDISRQFRFFQIGLAGLLLFAPLALLRFLQPVYEAGVLFSSRRWAAALATALAVNLLGLALLAVSQSALRPRLALAFDRLIARLSRLGKANLALFGLVVLAFSYQILGRYAHFFTDTTVRLFFLYPVVLAGSILLRASGVQRSWIETAGAALLLAALGYRLATYATEISTYPFTLAWSEASRYYYASLFMSERIYGIATPPTVLHPSRYLMQSVPFLIPNSPLWLHRAWQVFLWVLTTSLATILLLRRLQVPDRLHRWMSGAWAYLFLLTGPVYYHLLVPVILVFWGVQLPKAEGEPVKTAVLRNWAVVLLASAWAGISRVNWFPVPGMLAASLYFLEKPVGKRSFWRYLVLPLAWTFTGMLTAFGAQALYAFLSNNPAEQFASSLSSDLLWYRLLPNATYPLGIILASLLVTAPVLLVLYARLSGRWRFYHPIRLLGLGSILAVLFGGGLVVSTKIGGGSNLHNLDAYLVILLTTSLYILFDRFTPEPGGLESGAEPATMLRSPAVTALLLALALIFPVYEALHTGYKPELASPEKTKNSLEEISTQVRKTIENGRTVLFISERQLLTFGLVPQAEMVPDYEKVFLMEMAMSGNPEYMARFHNDLKTQRFGLIVSEPLFTRYKGPEKSWGEENDAWVSWVSEPMLCSYAAKETLKSVGVQLLVPRQEPLDCP